MGSLVAEHGCRSSARVTRARQRATNSSSTSTDASSGESFSCADPRESFIFEMISKGKYERGAVWVAQRIPEGHVSGTANQARIRTIDFKDPANFIHSGDVVSFARKHLGYKGTDSEFSFSDFYDPVDFVSARVSEGRVWSLFNHLNASGCVFFTHCNAFALLSLPFLFLLSRLRSRLLSRPPSALSEN